MTADQERISASAEYDAWRSEQISCICGVPIFLEIITTRERHIEYWTDMRQNTFHFTKSGYPLLEDHTPAMEAK